MNIIQRPSKNFGSRCGYVPDVIALHITEGGFEGAVETLCGGDGRQVSSNYVVGRAGQVAQLVDVRNEAWCNGTQSGSPAGVDYVGRATAALVRQRKVNANLYTVSIECEGWTSSTHGILTDAQFSAVVELIQRIRQDVKAIYGVTIPIDRDHIIGHCEIAPREKPDCPGRDFPWSRLIAALKGVETAPLLHMDFPADESTIIDRLQLIGWAVAPEGIARVDVYYDGAHGLASIRSFSERDDVQRTINPTGIYKDALHSGICLSFQPGRIPAGRHSLDVALITQQGRVVWVHRTITVR